MIFINTVHGISLEPQNLKALYENQGGYLSKFVAATEAAERAGFVLESDARLLIAEAESVDLGA